MIVKHNITAMNSNRMLGLTTSSQAKSTEKLSSGYKINRAADDAAGLSISEKMRRQVRGLTQASANAQDGISVVQTAEGALNEVEDMLQRMNELAVKGENGTLTTSDRAAIQAEIGQLMSEVDRVQSTTTFNEMNLLDGKFIKGIQVGAEAGQHIDISIKNMSMVGLASYIGTWKNGASTDSKLYGIYIFLCCAAVGQVASVHNEVHIRMAVYVGNHVFCIAVPTVRVAYEGHCETFFVAAILFYSTYVVTVYVFFSVKPHVVWMVVKYTTASGNRHTGQKNG